MSSDTMMPCKVDEEEEKTDEAQKVEDALEQLDPHLASDVIT